MTDFSSGFFGNKSIGFGKGSKTNFPIIAVYVEILGGQTLNDYSVILPVDSDWIGGTNILQTFEPTNWSQLTNWKNATTLPDGIGVGYAIEYRDGYIYRKSITKSLIVNFSHYILPGRHISPVNNISKIKINEDTNGNPIYEECYVVTSV